MNLTFKHCIINYAILYLNDFTIVMHDCLRDCTFPSLWNDFTSNLTYNYLVWRLQTKLYYQKQKVNWIKTTTFSTPEASKYIPIVHELLLLIRIIVIISHSTKEMCKKLKELKTLITYFLHFWIKIFKWSWKILQFVLIVLKLVLWISLLSMREPPHLDDNIFVLMTIITIYNLVRMIFIKHVDNLYNNLKYKHNKKSIKYIIYSNWNFNHKLMGSTSPPEK